MDIPVSRLNQRMALQLPAELPLGLVFVVGQVHLPAEAEDAESSRPADFFLRDEDYRLPCRLSERAKAEFHLQDGGMVRAGGHLVFEPALARYYLLARDIERLDSFRPAARPLSAIIADNSRREQVVSLAPAELPPWVQQMAPPEVRPQPHASPQQFVSSPATPQQPDGRADGLAQPGPQLGGDWELLADAEAAVAYPEAEPALAGLSNELIAFLSQAMDSQVEVEITPEIMTDLNTTGRTERLSAEVLEALDLFEASVDRDGRDQAGGQTGGAGQAPAEQVASPLDLEEGAAALGELAPVGEPITAAEFSRALESALPAEPAAEVVPAMSPVAKSSAAKAPAAKAPATKTPPAARTRQTARPGKSNDVIPWYVALLIILVVVILLAALVYFALFPDNLPVNLSLALPLQPGLVN